MTLTYFTARSNSVPYVFVWEKVITNFSEIIVVYDIKVGWLCWGLTSQSTIFQSCRDGAIASWVINQYFRGVKCLAQGHNTAAVGFEPRTSRSGVWHSTTEPPRSPIKVGRCSQLNEYMKLWVPKVRVIHWPCSKPLRFNIFKLLFLNNHWF